MVITLCKRQLTFQQRKDIINALLFYGLAYVQSIVRHFQCSESTVWRIWSLYQNYGQNDEAILLKVRHSHHPNEHTQAEHDLIVQVLAEYPKYRYTEIYTILVERGYNRSYKGMWGYISKNNLHSKQKIEYRHHINKPYETPTMLGMKWQMDIKFVEARFTPNNKKYYQYTMIDECTRESFQIAFFEKSTYSTKHFVILAIRHFGYKPLTIQTDNGTEFTNRLMAKKEESKINLVDALLNKLHITHQLIPPATPRQDGKVERLHRENEYEYQGQQFNDIYELNLFLQNIYTRFNKRFTFALCTKCRKSPNMKRTECIDELKRFACDDLKLNRKVKMQELIYAYAEYLRINQLRQETPPTHPITLPQGIEHAPDIQKALSRL